MALTNLIAGNPDQQFVARVRASLAKACSAIQFEAVGTANHAVRLALVGRLLSGLDNYAQRFAVYVACDGTFFAAQSTLTGATDAQIDSAVNGLLDMFALQGA
jgi:hypothetical protein